MDRMPRYRGGSAAAALAHPRAGSADRPLSPLECAHQRPDEALAELADLTDRKEIASRVDEAAARGAQGQQGTRGQGQGTAKAGLDMRPAGRRGVRPGTADATGAGLRRPARGPRNGGGLIEQAALLEKALFVAAHFDRKDHIHPLVQRFHKLLQAQRGNGSSLQALDSLAGQCFRGLRKLGMREEIDTVLRQMAGRHSRRAGHPNRGRRSPSRRASQIAWPAALRALCTWPAGWFYFGKDRQAEPILQAVRGLLFAGELPAQEQTHAGLRLRRRGGPGAGGGGAEAVGGDLPHKLKGIRDTYTTYSHFSLSQLDVVEAVVLAVVSDDFTMGTQARRWLDDDEFLVRRRIHRDLRN